ncbi:phosphotransferase enzyme family protein [Legionella fallonii]|uniref:Protein kinase domain-containing protein n=1 Tax=Legionella fallonii LLAP-10 TaxID=1212491 RepID=A0A098G6T7_9GAMM|nr:phosphotransferase [Legionella fallonii]CEG57205.1 protein of unknown function [Legionella fallonii LLAP-10]
MASFKQTSYLSWVRRFREMAEKVVAHYPIKTESIDLIKYNANAIFKVTDTQKKKYILRIHPYGYHTEQAILEEIKWLHHITNTTDLLVPKPMRTIAGGYLVEEKHPTIPTARFCDLFEWRPGKVLWKSIDTHYSYNLGSVMAQLQKNGKYLSIEYRKYWCVDGLIGTDRAKLYNVEQLTDVYPAEQKKIIDARRLAYHVLKSYEKLHKERSGLIHNDLQPNNFIYHQGSYAVIDFDDCGIGLYGDDLSVALFAFEYLVEGENRRDFSILKDALFNGYSEHMPLPQEEIDLMPYFLLARKLNSISWLELRKKDNPKLDIYHREAVLRAIQFFEYLTSTSDN